MTGTLDKMSVLRHLSALESYLTQLEPFRDLDFETFQRSPASYWAVQHGLLLCIQNVIDISAHIVSALALPPPEDYHGAILALGKHGVIPAEFAQRIAPMAGLRNLLVHEYLEVDLNKVYQVLQEGLEDFRAFARHIVAFLERNGTI